jgi:hypothetical protein
MRQGQEWPCFFIVNTVLLCYDRLTPKSQTIREGGAESHGSLNPRYGTCEWLLFDLARFFAGRL